MKGSYNGLKPKFEANLKSCAGQNLNEKEHNDLFFHAIVIPQVFYVAIVSGVYRELREGFLQKTLLRSIKFSENQFDTNCSRNYFSENVKVCRRCLRAKSWCKPYIDFSFRMFNHIPRVWLLILMWLDREKAYWGFEMWAGKVLENGRDFKFHK